MQKRRLVESRPLPEIPRGNLDEILQCIKFIIEQDYEMIAIGQALEKARDNANFVLRKIGIIHVSYLGKMSHMANLYSRKEPKYALTKKEKNLLLNKINKWIANPKN